MLEEAKYFLLILLWICGPVAM